MTSLTQPPVIRRNENHFRSHKNINAYDNFDTIFTRAIQRHSAPTNAVSANDTAITI